MMHCSKPSVESNGAYESGNRAGADSKETQDKLAKMQELVCRSGEDTGGCRTSTTRSNGMWQRW